MRKGYIKLWRKSIDSGMLKNHKLWVFWTWCLMKASHQEYSDYVGNQQVYLLPGQFVFGRKSASFETGISEQTIRTLTKILKKSKNLTIKSTNKFSIISIINWDIYQPKEKKSTSKSTCNQPATNQQLTTNKNKRIKEQDIYTELFEYLKSKTQNGFIQYQDKIIEFYKYRMEMPKAKRYKTEKGINGLLRDVSLCIDKKYPVGECLDVTMEKEWLAPPFEFFDKYPFKKQPELVRTYDYTLRT